MENFVTSGHIMAYRKQYAMNHVGASTVRLLEYNMFDEWHALLV